MHGFSIGKLAKAAGVSVDTIRFYEKNELLPAAQRRPSGFRLYEADTLRRLIFIRHAREVGFSLEEIADLLQVFPAQDAATVARIIEDKLMQLEQKLVELEHWWRMLRELHVLATSSTTWTQSIVDFFESEASGAMAPVSRSAPPSGDSHESK